MKVVSLFSGAGGLDLGFKMAGHEIVWANDLYSDAVIGIWKKFCNFAEIFELYTTEVIEKHIVLEDISKINTDDIPACDIVIGGFPCQGFSVANTKRHEGDERNAWSCSEGCYSVKIFPKPIALFHKVRYNSLME